MARWLMLEGGSFINLDEVSSVLNDFGENYHRTYAVIDGVKIEIAVFASTDDAITFSHLILDAICHLKYGVYGLSEDTNHFEHIFYHTNVSRWMTK